MRAISWLFTRRSSQSNLWRTRSWTSRRAATSFDSFLGSGTTVIAAERTGRRCYDIELDPLYVDTIIRRWQAFTGEQARHASSDRTFVELEAEVGKDHA